MIGFAYDGLQKDLKDIWVACFGAEDEANLFFKKRFSPENTVVYFDNHKAVSVLYLLDAQIVISGVEHSAKYIFAAGTLPEYRKRGIMAQLINFAIDFAKQQNIDYLFLKPAEKKLFDYYAKFGFSSDFKLKKLEINRNLLRALAGNYEVSTPYDLSDITDIRNSALKRFDYVKWSKEAIDYAIQVLKLYDGHMTYQKHSSYSLYYEKDNTAYIYELCSKVSSIAEVARELYEKSKCENFVFTLPMGFPLTSDNIEVVQNGMLLPLNGKAREAKTHLSSPYLELTLD